MDGSRFDAITRTLAASRSRRTAVRAFAAGAVAGGLSHFALDDAKTKKKRKKKLKKNEYGCVNVDKACRDKDANCCSGICQGKKPKKGEKDKSRCVAHDVLDCPVGADSCQQALISCGTNGECYQTTGQASFCGGGGVSCFACTKDVDCEPDFGPGAACIVCPGCSSTGDTACESPAVQCPDGTELCGGECVAECLAGVQTRNPFDCSCCQLNNAPPSPGCASLGPCCSGICLPVNQNVGMCAGIAAGDACEFDAQCQSDFCDGVCFD